MTPWELSVVLHEAGWSQKEVAARAAVPAPYVFSDEAAEKHWYVRRGTLTWNLGYMKCLALAERLHQHGLPDIPHLAAVEFYEEMLEEATGQKPKKRRKKKSVGLS